MKILSDTEVKKSVLQSAAQASMSGRAITSGKKEAKVRFDYAIRYALGLGVILSWAVLPLNSALAELAATWQTPRQTVQGTVSKTELFIPALTQAGTYCPPQSRVLILNSGTGVGNLTQYYVYPRRVDLIELSQPFTASDLDAHKGGCLLYYGAEAGQRLDPFRSRLTQIKCSGDGCLYGIER